MKGGRSGERHFWGRSVTNSIQAGRTLGDRGDYVQGHDDALCVQICVCV